MTDNFPTQTINRNQGQPITLRHLFQKENGNYVNFDPNVRSSDNLLYSIPEHQRYESWEKEKKEKLIDSTFRGYTIGGIILTTHTRNGVVKYDIEDGQSRLSVLHKFHNNKFRFENMYFKDLTLDQQNRFLNYTITPEILTKVDGQTEDDFQQDIWMMFERAQIRVALTNQDTYWNRKTTPGVMFAEELIQEYSVNENCLLGTNEYGDKKRTILPEFCAMIGAVLYGNYDIPFRFQYANLYKSINDEQKIKVRNFLTHYYSIIDRAENVNIETTTYKQSYAKCTQFWGSVCMDWLEVVNSGETQENMDASIREQCTKWIDIITISRRSPNFIKKGKTLYNGLRSASKQNTTSKDVRKRLERVNRFYSDKEGCTNEHGIQWVVANNTE